MKTITTSKTSAALRRAFKATANRARTNATKAKACVAANIEYNNALDALSPEDLARYTAAFPLAQDPADFINEGNPAVPVTPTPPTTT